MAVDIHITESRGIEIVFNLGMGAFEANIEDKHFVSPTLRNLLEQLDAYQVKVADRNCHDVTPVPLVFVMEEGEDGLHRLIEAEVYGVVAGRTYYDRALCVQVDGCKKQIRGRRVYVFHPDDPRLYALRGLFEEERRAMVVLTTVQRELEKLRLAGTELEIPAPQSNEQARAEEPAFLARLRNIQPQAVKE